MEPELDVHQTIASSFDIRSKLIAFLTVLVGSFLFNHPVYHLLIGVMVLIASLDSGLTVKRLFESLRPLLPILILILIFAGFTDSRYFRWESSKVVLFAVWNGSEVTRGGIFLGFTFGLRLINMVIMTKTLLVSTPLDDFIQLFHKLKLPGSLSLVITTAIRFFPELECKKQLIINAQRARGADVDESGYLRGLYIRLTLMVPLIINSLILAEKLSLALLTRGFGYTNRWTDLTELQLKQKDYLLIVLCLLCLCVGLAVTILFNWGTL